MRGRRTDGMLDIMDVLAELREDVNNVASEEVRLILDRRVHKAQRLVAEQWESQQSTGRHVVYDADEEGAEVRYAQEDGQWDVLIVKKRKTTAAKLLRSSANALKEHMNTVGDMDFHTTPKGAVMLFWGTAKAKATEEREDK